MRATKPSFLLNILSLIAIYFTLTSDLGFPFPPTCGIDYTTFHLSKVKSDLLDIIVTPQLRIPPSRKNVAYIVRFSIFYVAPSAHCAPSMQKGLPALTEPVLLLLDETAPSLHGACGLKVAE